MGGMIILLHDNIEKFLLEIQNAVGCMYISDLPSYYNKHDRRMIRFIMRVPTTQYSVDVWNETFRYLTKRKCNFKSVHEAKEKVLLFKTMT